MESLYSIGDVLKYANWSSLDYWQKKVGKSEIKQLEEITKILRQKRTDSQAKEIAESIRKWAKFNILPFNIRAATLYVLAKEEENPSYRRLCVEEFGESLLRFIKGVSKSSPKVQKKLKKAVGAFLEEKSLPEALKTLKQAILKNREFQKKRDEFIRLKSIMSKNNWEHFCTDDEKGQIYYALWRIPGAGDWRGSKDKEGHYLVPSEKKFIIDLEAESLVSDEEERVLSELKRKASPETKDLLSETLAREASDRVKKSLRDESSGIYKACLEKAKKLVMGEQLARAEEEYAKDFTKIILDAPVDLTQEKISEQLKPLFPGLTDLFIEINDQERRVLFQEKAQKKGVKPEQIKQGLLGEKAKAFLLENLRTRAKERETQRERRERAIDIAQKVANIACIGLLLTVTLPVSIFIMPGVLAVLVAPIFET